MVRARGVTMMVKMVKMVMVRAAAWGGVGITPVGSSSSHS